MRTMQCCVYVCLYVPTRTGTQEVHRVDAVCMYMVGGERCGYVVVSVVCKYDSV